MAWVARGKQLLKGTAPVAIGAAVMGGVAFASDDVLHPPSYPFAFKGYFTTYDAASIRRGYEVYTQVCATCHSLNLVAYRTLIDVCFTEEDVKKLTANFEVEDGPNDDGEMFERPGKPADKFPAPYANEQQARSINNGANPPDLSLITKARHNGQDYLFALLLGYKDPPAGVVADNAAGQYYNPYFPGGKIGMPKQLQDGGVEYTDGTPATESQMAKDVVEFLSWAAEPEADERKRLGMKWMAMMIAMCALTGYYKRFRWGHLKTRKITYLR